MSPPPTVKTMLVMLSLLIAALHENVTEILLNIQGAFFNCSAQISVLKRKTCSTNEDLLYIENFMEQNL